MASDFVDNDLLRPAPAEPAAGKAAGDALLYERLKRRVEDDESRASDELERIRKRSEEVERQRQALRALRGKQADFDRSYRELSERVKRHIVLLKGEEEQASRAATVCHETRHRFESLAEELDRIDPESWTEASLETDLTQALAQVESARAVFRKGGRPRRGARVATRRGTGTAGRRRLDRNGDGPPPVCRLAEDRLRAGPADGRGPHGPAGRLPLGDEDHGGRRDSVT